MKKIKTYGDPRVFLWGVIIGCLLIGAVTLIGIFQEEVGEPDGWLITEHFDVIMGAIIAFMLLIVVDMFIPTEVEFDSEHISKKHLIFHRSMNVQDITSMNCRLMGHIGEYAIEIKISGREKNMKIYQHFFTKEQYEGIRSGTSDFEIMELHEFLQEICPEKMTTDWSYMPRE